MQVGGIRSHEGHAGSQSAGLVKQLKTSPVQLQARVHIIELPAGFNTMGKSSDLLLPHDRLRRVPTLDVAALVRKIVACPQLRPYFQQVGSFCQIAVVTAAPLNHRFQKFASDDAPFRNRERCATAHKIRGGFARPDNAQSVIAEKLGVVNQIDGHDVRFAEVPLNLEELVRHRLTLLVVGLGQALYPIVDIPEASRIHEPQLVSHKRTREEQPGRELGNGLFAKVNAGNEIGDVEFIPVPDELAMHAHYAARPFSEFGGVSCKVHIYTFDCVQGNTGREAASRGVRQIDPIQLIPNLVGARTVDVKLTAAVTYHARH